MALVSVALVVVAVATPSDGTGRRAAVGGRQAAAAAPLRWSAPLEVDAGPPFGPANHLTALACPTTSLCVAGDAGGRVLVTTDPTGGAPSWRAVPVDPGGSLTALACPTTSLCVAGDAGGRVLVTTDPTGGAPSWRAVPVDAGRRVLSVSCPTTS
ncbi:MAG: hypothetical protein M0029_06860, partial [Actinomycetota bacterium]|nr:hypothetical protein [Actinomycetota bacterium]